MKALIVVCLLWAVTASQESFTKIHNDFGVALYHKLGELGHNVFLSPLSVATIVGMVHLGARGSSRDQLEAVLGYQDAAISGEEAHVAFRELLGRILAGKKGYDLTVASAVFVSAGTPVFEKYQKDLAKYYQSGLYSADFAGSSVEATEDINSWVRDMTGDKVPSILDRPLPPSVPLLVLNAVHFKGKWENQFHVSNTEKETFYNRGTDPVKVDTMKQTAELVHAFSTELDAQILELPYVGDRVVMVLVLPTEKTGLPSLEKKFSLDAVRSALESSVQHRVTVSLPRFKLQETYNLKKPLQALGLRRVFEKPGANLTGIAPRPPLALDEVLHKALIQVDEEGSEAIAVSGGIISHSRLPPKDIVFQADHPFLFFIEDVPTKSVLFIGRLQEL
ncbi:intracellular coagulation inhibitor 1-like [Ornithodoros turicata]|uniref:intracellular coagulation inhibitor 1-like n=1 Tax=Ornithodoros turicata TaxID=34597 RepID=UPI003139997E